MGGSIVLPMPNGDRWDHFFSEPALSFSAQPLVQQMFENVAHGTEPVTLFLGAGVSIDAALPTWTQLIDNMAESITDPRWKDCISRDTSEPMRKAEYVAQLAAEGKTGVLAEVVRDALYRGSKDFGGKPGNLADAIARLVTMLGTARCRILTTNFDHMIETALGMHAPSKGIDSLTLNQIKGKKLPALKAGQFQVIHLHGLLEPGKAPRGPLVLTESQFLEHGPHVRELVKDALLRTQVIFVGVSLTDPNLVAPLWSLKNAKDTYKAPYAITVAKPLDTDDSRNARAFEIKKTDYLGKILNAQTIFLKSYSQVPQLFHELALAKGDPDGYFSDEAKTSLRYGYRLKRTLDDVYRHIGCRTVKQEIPVGAAALKLSEALHDQLYRAKNGQASIAAELSQAVADMPSSDNPSVRRSYEQYARALDSEKFGTFLWIRSRQQSGRRSEYQLKLVGTSVYVHSESWSLDRNAQIVSDSRHGAALAAYMGTANIQDLDEGREFQLWKTALHVPFAATGSVTPITLPGVDTLLDVISVGVISLHTRNSAIRDKEGRLKDARDASILAFLQDDALDMLKVRLVESALLALGIAKS